MMIEKISQEGLLALELFRLNPESHVSQEIMIQHLVDRHQLNEVLQESMDTDQPTKVPGLIFLLN